MDISLLLQKILADTVAIFTIMNPISSGVVMLSLLHEGATKKDVQTIAGKTSKALLVAMFITFLAGSYIFSFFGLTADALRVFGGIILLFMGINMVQGHDKRVNHNKTEHAAAQELNDISVVPLAIPIILGPGLATTLITHSVVANTWQDYLSTSLGIVLSVVAAFLILRNMMGIQERVGVNGIRVFNRLMGLVVGSLAAQMILRGVHALWVGI